MNRTMLIMRMRQRKLIKGKLFWRYLLLIHWGFFSFNFSNNDCCGFGFGGTNHLPKQKIGEGLSYVYSIDQRDKVLVGKVQKHIDKLKLHCFIPICNLSFLTLCILLDFTRTQNVKQRETLHLISRLWEHQF